MREIKASDVTETVARLFEEACYHLPDDVIAALKRAREQEKSPAARDVLDTLLQNAEIAAEGEIPLCQDTGAAWSF